MSEHNVRFVKQRKLEEWVDALLDFSHKVHHLLEENPAAYPLLFHATENFLNHSRDLGLLSVRDIHPNSFAILPKQVLIHLSPSGRPQEKTYQLKLNKLIGLAEEYNFLISVCAFSKVNGYRDHANNQRVSFDSHSWYDLHHPDKGLAERVRLSHGICNDCDDSTFGWLVSP